MFKKCNKCLIEKPLDNFFKDKNNKTDGHYSLCKSCKKESTIEWRNSNRKIYNETMREYNKKHYARLRLQRYKISPEQYEKMLSDQKFMCKLCGSGPSKKRPLAIDHHHDSGIVRGLLCYSCNRAIAILDNPKLLEKAIQYIKT